ncbi:MAG: FliH/SctL family protein [Planctomycetota bacterium]
MATIIKRDDQHQHPAGDAVRGVAFNFQDLAGHADEYVASVRREAAKVVQQAHADAEAVRAKAEQAGRQAAEAAIEQVLNDKVAQRMASIRPALDSLVDQLADARGAWLDHWDRSAVGLAARMAERIVRGQLEQRPEITVGWVREALQLASGSAAIRVRLNPADHQNLGPQVEALAESMGRLAGATLVADATVSAGGCVVETEYGTIDQQVESQLQRLIEDLT